MAYPGLTDERREIGEMAESYLTKSASEPSGGADLGWFGIGIPEEKGGSGGEFADLAPIIEAAGATCASTSVLWTTGVAGKLLVEAGGHDDLLATISDGSTQVALPVGDPAATVGRSELLLHGAENPTVVLVPIAEGVALVPVEALELEPAPSLDPSRFLHRARVSDLGDPPVLEGAHGRLRAAVALVAALDGVGAARVALSKTVAYSLERQQFGRQIGSFQAYKHRCATAFNLFKLAQTAAFRAAQDDDDQLALSAALVGAPNCTFICGDAVQLHGGIGFSWESGLHAYLKRARFAEIIAGGGDDLVDALLELCDIRPGR